ncbi:MAG: lipopolysaccharide biosynthesis protein [Solirubrobacteraceae bacterium]
MTESPGTTDLRARVLGGMAWTGASQIVAQLTRLVVALVVARLLGPSEFGLAALALVFASLVLVFSDLALGAAIVQAKHLSEDDRCTAFWIAVFSGVLFTIVGVLISGPVASLYGQPHMQPLLAVLSLSFLLTSLGSTQQALLLRDMNFRRLELLVMAGSLAGGAVAVALAAMGTGAWAIIGQQLAVALVTTALLWRATRWHPAMRMSRASFRHLVNFSSPLVGHRLLYYLHQNADNFLIGRAFGPAALGAYAIAYNVMLVPASRIGGPIQRVLAPAFARMQDEPQRIAIAWARVGRIIATVAVPALAGIAVVAPDFVRVVLGERWDAAIPIIQVLAWVGILQAIQTVNVDILVARGRTATMFRYSLLFVAAHLTAFIVGLHWGVIGVAVAYAISSTLVEPVLTVLTARNIGVSPFVFVRAVAGVFQAAAVMAIVVLLGRFALVEAGLPAAPRLALLVILGLAVYVPMCLWRAPEILEEARSLRGRFGRRRVIVPPTAPAGT